MLPHLSHTVLVFITTLIASLEISLVRIARILLGSRGSLRSRYSNFAPPSCQTEGPM